MTQEEQPPTEETTEEPVIQDPALIDQPTEPETAPEVPEGGTAPQDAPPPPVPLQGEPAGESLAQKAYRESRTVVESASPSDVVPNRPNIRDPETYTSEEAIQEIAAGQEGAAAAAEEQVTEQAAQQNAEREAEREAALTGEQVPLSTGEQQPSTGPGA